MTALHLVGGVRHAVLDLGLRRAFIRPAPRYQAVSPSAAGSGRGAAELPSIDPAPGQLLGHWEADGDGHLCCRWRLGGQDAE